MLCTFKVAVRIDSDDRVELEVWCGNDIGVVLVEMVSAVAQLMLIVVLGVVSDEMDEV